MKPLRWLWNLQLTFDDKDKWFLVGMVFGAVATTLVFGLAQGWLPVRH